MYFTGARLQPPPEESRRCLSSGRRARPAESIRRRRGRARARRRPRRNHKSRLARSAFRRISGRARRPATTGESKQFSPASNWLAICCPPDRRPFIVVGSLPFSLFGALTRPEGIRAACQPLGGGGVAKTPPSSLRAARRSICVPLRRPCCCASCVTSGRAGPLS
jgi:hypothetical protein